MTQLGFDTSTENIRGHLKSVFLSYSWDSEAHTVWVARLGDALRGAGLDVRLDQVDLRPGSDLTKYMETAVRESDYVLLICTPGFAQRSDARIGGVGYEHGLVTGEIFSGVAETEKFIPILRGDPAESIPSFLRSRKWVDFREEPMFDARVAELISSICHGISKSDFGTQDLGATHRDADINEDLRVYKGAFDFACTKMGKTKSSAEDFSEEYQRDWSLAALRVFEQVFTFANSSMKLSRSDAEDFALKWMEHDGYDHFDQYRDAFEFAASRDGRNLCASEARRFVGDFEEEVGLEHFHRFKQAFRIARDGGRSRSDAEDFAFDQL